MATTRVDCRSPSRISSRSLLLLTDSTVGPAQRAKRHRELGNSLFHAGRLREATEAYTRAVELLELEELEEEEELSQLLSTARAERGEVERGALAVCLSNRAACWLRRKQWRLALADCNRVIRSGRMDSLVVKAYFRRGKAHEVRPRRGLPSAAVLTRSSSLCGLRFPLCMTHRVGKIHGACSSARAPRDRRTSSM